MVSGSFLSFIPAWESWVWIASIQIGFLVLAIFAIEWAIPRSWPKIRYALWALVLLKAILPPTLGVPFGVGEWGSPILEEGKVQLVQQLRTEPNRAPATEIATRTDKTDSPAVSLTKPVTGGSPSPLPINGLLLFIWGAGVLLFLGYTGIRYASLRNRIQKGETIEEGPIRIELERLSLSLGKPTPPKLILLKGIESPFLCGLVQPTIVLPAKVTQTLSESELRNVLLHELIHWKNWDLLVGWIQGIIQAIYWFHPLVWFANSRIRHERERVVDDTVLNVGSAEPKHYGESILKVLLAAEGRSAVGLGLLGIFERNTQLQRRMEGIMTHRSDRSNGNFLGWVFVAVFAAVFLPMAPMAENPSDTSSVVLKHDDGTSDGMQSYGGAGHAIRFECPSENGLLTGISVYGSRYGNPKPPEEDFAIQVLGDFGEYGLAVQTVIEKPYSLFERGDPKWVDIDFEATKVPKEFWVLIDFNAHQTKGVYVHYDESNETSYSMKAVPDGKAFHLEEIDRTWNWMVRANLVPGRASTEETERASEPQPVGPIKIVSTIPEVGATDVDPSLSEITVAFDRPMNMDGYSWTGGGPDFPKTPEGKRAFWKDNRTCVLPVELEAGHYYRVGINSNSHRNFKSVSGTPVQPSAVYFTTKGATDETIQKTTVPEVVAISPPNGAEGVDPNLGELKVEFTVPMAGGFSWCGGGDHFPEIPEGKKPYWSEDKKTCFLPVNLKPDWEYHLGINCPSFRNFQSEGGIPVEPMGYSFKTAGE